MTRPAALIALVLLALLATLPAAAHAADIGVVAGQLRLTKVGADGNADVDANDPAIAYNSNDDEFLLAWAGNISPTGTVQIRGQILNGDGTPKSGLLTFTSFVSAQEPSQPIVSYSPRANQYMLAYVGPVPVDPANPPPNNPAGQMELVARTVSTSGVPGIAQRISNTDPGNVDAEQVSEPAVSFAAERNQYRFVWLAETATEGDVEVQTQATSDTIALSGSQQTVSTTTGSPSEPVITYLPAQNRFVAAWKDGGILAVPLTVSGTQPTGIDPVPVSTGTAFKPSIDANPNRNEALITFVKNAAPDGDEVFAQRVRPDTGAETPNGVDQPISSMGPAEPSAALDADTVRATTTTYHPGLDRYLITWAGENGPTDRENERFARALDGSGTALGGDEFQLSFTGDGGNTLASPALGADTVAIPGKRAWFSVWDADDARPPLADGEDEIYGRFAGDDGDLDGFTVPDDCNDADAGIHPGVTDALDNGTDEDCSGADAENPDRDGDGSPRPADCNDANAAIRPGAADTPDNVIDEDCSGADAVNLDRDGDGSLRPLDCNDANAGIRPGAADTPRNGVDEDCSGKDAAFPTLTSGILPTWNVRGKRITLVGLQITQQFPNGLRAKILCDGKKCPLERKALKLGKVKRAAANAIGSLKKKQRKFRAGQTVEVWVSATGFNTKVSRFALKKGKVPTTQPFCVIPGEQMPRKDCAT